MVVWRWRQSRLASRTVIGSPHFLEECCGPIVWDACHARGFAVSSGLWARGIVGEDKFAFNNSREATLRHELFGRWPSLAGACATCHDFLLRFRQRQGRIRPRKG